MSGSKKGTYPADVVLLLPVELCSALDIGVYLAAEFKLLLPDVLLHMLGADEVLRNASLNNCRARPFTGWTGPGAAPGSNRNLAAGADRAERGA